jgi:hypothetical protein
MCATLREQIGGRISIMRLRAALTLSVALALPAWAQHPGGQGGGISGQHGGGGGHAGGAGNAGGGARGGGYGGGTVHGGAPRYGGARGGYSGGTGAPSYSGLVGMQAPSSFSQPGLLPMPGRLQPPPRAGVPLPYRGNGFSGGYGHGPDDRDRGGHRGRYRGHDHDRRYRGRGAYGYAPGYVYAYPYVADPGYYDWGATDYSENQQEPYADAQPEQGPDYGNGPEAPYPPNGDAPPYPQQQQNVEPGTAGAPVGPQRQEYHFASSSATTASAPAKPLTVIFKGDRAPEKMHNFMVTATALTNLDGEHFEKIPLDQIDVAATQHANRSSGIDFQVPTASRD